MSPARVGVGRHGKRADRGLASLDLLLIDYILRHLGHALPYMERKPLVIRPCARHITRPCTILSSAARPVASLDYSAADIEVLEGLEPVRRRPGMFIGGTDERALHHLVAELLDNAMDEAVAGHASWIEVRLEAEGAVTVRDNGRGIPVDPHPKFPDRSALEVILTTLHSGGKFGAKVYQTAGGLHGVGVSVVNALADELTVEVARDRQLWRQRYVRGKPTSELEPLGSTPNRRGTTVRFTPDPEIFGKTARFKPALLHRMARSKAYLFRGVEIRWQCDPSLLDGAGGVPEREVFHFPAGLEDFLKAMLAERECVTDQPFVGQAELGDGQGRVEWAIAWPLDEEPYLGLYCNTVPTPQGGSHEQALRDALLRALRAYGELTGNKKVAQVTADDLLGSACVLLSLFTPNPQFQGQTKDRLVAPEAGRQVELSLKDHFDHWLSGHAEAGRALLEHVLGRAEERLARKRAKEVARKTATRKLRLPGKLADCSADGREGTEIFLVEGDSAGGSAKQARIARDPGDPAAARQDPERRQRQRRQAARQQGARRSGHRARLRPGQGATAATTCATTRSSS